MRRAAKVDANQRELVEQLRGIGMSVQPLHSVGGGCPDLLCGWQGQNFLLEVKPEGVGVSKQRQNLRGDHQPKWHDEWRGQVAVVHNVTEALEACGIQFRGQIS
ncbi:hypothetical protein ACRARG_04675 [Pseudooceanicola sp. C21-150M6]|uniref:hypothetical protein n=1 Tax=Pseudooceanicola sp. C21-150M6 TaxID=3434355 RepID=UPI003D7F8C17